MKGKVEKRDMFSDNPWNDTPYFDMFEDVWFTPGFVDKSDVNDLDLHNRRLVDPNTPKEHLMCSWPERV